MAKDYLPEDRPIPPRGWSRRNSIIVRLVWIYACVLVTISVFFKEQNLEGIVASLVIGVHGAAAIHEWDTRRTRSCLASVGLLIAVMFVDLDRCKPINDTWGYHVGDRVLLDIADH